MLEVVVVINRSAVTKIPIKWQLVLELLHHVFSIFLPYSNSLLARSILQKVSTSSHHHHQVIRILRPP